jgi:hypothetical protein
MVLALRDDGHADDVALFNRWVDAGRPVRCRVFCEGLRRLEGKDVTWEACMKALESAPFATMDEIING